MIDVVLDASAVLAFLRREPGAENVEPHLRGGYLSAVNYTEVFAKAAGVGIDFDSTHYVMNNLGVIRIPFDDQLARVTASLLPETKKHGLSLADRACLALGRFTGRPILTTDRKWLEAVPDWDVRLVR